MKTKNPIIIFVITLFIFIDGFAQTSTTLHSTDIRIARPNRRCPANYAEARPMSDFSFVGYPLTSNGATVEIAACVLATTDEQAKSACGPSYGIFNPGNPWYNAYSNRGTIKSNSLGYYYCIRNDTTIYQIRSLLCSRAMGDARFRQFTFTMAVVEEEVTCSCKPNAAPDSAYTPGCPQVAAIASTGEGAPRLDIDTSVFALDDSVTLNGQTVSQASVSAVSGTAAPADPHERLNQCTARFRDRGRSCKSGAQDTERICERTNSNNQLVDGASGALAVLGQGVSLANQGQGVQGTCFRAGGMALGARAALDTIKQNCTAGETICNTSCASGQMDNFLNECAREAGFADFDSLNAQHSDWAQNLQTAKTEITQNFDEGAEICSTRVRPRRITLDSLVSDLGRTLQASTICACQTSSANGTDCNQIPTIDTCQTNPNATGCQAYQPVGVCAVGTQYYNAQACNCSQNPSAAGCLQVNPTGTTVSNFGGNLAASSPLNAGGSGGVSFGGGGGSSGGGSFSDLSIPGGGGSAVPANFAGNIKAGEISSGGAATGASVGGGGGNGGAGLAGNVSGTAGPAPEKGLGSLFKDLKNVVSNVFGGGTKSAPSAQKTNGAINTDRFKPNTKLRGGPIQRDIASANEKTLFELVNDCANGLRCKNSGDLMVNP